MAVGAMASAALAAPTAKNDMVVVTRGAATEEMDAAEELARDSFDVFVKANTENDGGNSYFAVKVGKPTPKGGGEFLWIQPESFKNDKWSGRLLNTAIEIPNLKAGDLVKFVDDDIVDWTFTRGGKAYGQFTTRVMLKYAPADQKVEAAQQLERLWPTPLPPPEKH